MAGDATWKRCSSCKRDIPFRAPYYTCSVSTCQRGDTALAFCSVECCDAHIPLLRHRDASAIEERAPSAEQWAAARQADPAPHGRDPGAQPAAAPRRRIVAPTPSPRDPTGSGDRAPRDVLIVVSKLKAYVRAVGGMNTSDGVADVLSDRVRRLCDTALERAREAGRKTLMDRDFR